LAARTAPGKLAEFQAIGPAPLSSAERNVIVQVKPLDSLPVSSGSARRMDTMRRATRLDHRVLWRRRHVLQPFVTNAVRDAASAWRMGSRQLASTRFRAGFEGMAARPGAGAGEPSFRKSRAQRHRKEERMHGDPRFWAVFVAIWLGLVLAAMNIAVKIHMFMDLAQGE
jgi:hypothetical protein